jgi:hypothetical protein
MRIIETACDTFLTNRLHGDLNETGLLHNIHLRRKLLKQ